jgi:Cof subfamily protein (haloacid dehalogenase superfamily)
MTYRLIAIDLDGTLLNPQHQLTEANRTTIMACLEQGARVVLATGRLFASARYYAHELGLRGPQITLNGAVIADAETDRLIVRTRLGAEQLAAVIDTLADHQIPYTIFGPDAIYAEPGTPHLQVLDGYGEPPTQIRKHAELLRLGDPIKVLTFLEPSPLDAELADRLKDKVDIVRTGERFLEFLPIGVSKGDALTALMSREGIAAEEVLAIGDGENDLSMFAVAGMSVAMASAPPLVRAGARDVTADCSADGVALALRKHVLG